MARALRTLIPGGYYHVTRRGNERKAIFRDDTDRWSWCIDMGQSDRRRSAKRWEGLDYTAVSRERKRLRDRIQKGSALGMAFVSI